MDGIDQGSQAGLIRLVPDMPLRRPEQMRMAEEAGASRHPRQSQIGRIRQNGRHERDWILRRRPGSKMAEPVRKIRPAVDLGEKDL